MITSGVHGQELYPLFSDLQALLLKRRQYIVRERLAQNQVDKGGSEQQTSDDAPTVEPLLTNALSVLHPENLWKFIKEPLQQTFTSLNGNRVAAITAAYPVTNLCANVHKLELLISGRSDWRKGDWEQLQQENKRLAEQFVTLGMAKSANDAPFAQPEWWPGQVQTSEMASLEATSRKGEWPLCCDSHLFQNPIVTDRTSPFQISIGALDPAS